MCLENLLNNKYKLKHKNNYRRHDLFLCAPPMKQIPEVLFCGTKELPAIVVSPATSRDSTSLFIRSKPKFLDFCK
ncbi:hypothetical protein MERGE_002701 [Pneumocystis wakefieldiae]|uniref:Uncharacterized protein n=1 Tax=Pneumocystis wakefieldiae TaxID=38082 RepID=A0A899FUD5_9ASCO|nr:hypothetical protein MERGE_002701 [Pneumocystis wakefieldiae]